ALDRVRGAHHRFDGAGVVLQALHGQQAVLMLIGLTPQTPYWLLALVFFCFASLLARFIWLQVYKHSDYVAQAEALLRSV
ncbi:hypothetical protein KVP70_33275, partial [Duganella sp. HSC-15S17]